MVLFNALTGKLFCKLVFGSYSYPSLVFAQTGNSFKLQTFWYELRRIKVEKG
jgi:hypothetical protein